MIGIATALTAAAALTLPAFAPSMAAASPRVTVSSAAEFQAAVTRLRHSGGTIVLQRHRYRQLVVGPRARYRLTIRGRGAGTGLLLLEDTQAVDVHNLRITPRTQAASAQVHDSARITLSHMHVRGTTRLAGAISLIDSTGVVIEDSNMSLCGDYRDGAQGFCLRLRHNSRVTVRDNAFHDCYGCDFIHGARDHHLNITRNSFRRALVGPCGRDVVGCNHQDLIQIAGGSAFRITRNLFGVYDFGAAQVYLTETIRGVRIQNNVFRRTDPKAPGVIARDGIKLGNQRTPHQPLGAIVTENTILSGAPRHDDVDNSVILSSPYAAMARSKRPLIVNNVIARTNTPTRLCRLGRVTTNVVARGAGCNAANTVGDPALDRLGRPTAASVLVIDRALAAFAAAIDFRGVRRDDAPDIGAYEYIVP